MGIGLLTGLLGAGGGFLIIPVLIFSFHLPVREAIGTSLMIIAINNLLGFSGDIFHTDINWPLLLTVTAMAIAGILPAQRLVTKIHGDKLKRLRLVCIADGFLYHIPRNIRTITFCDKGHGSASRYFQLCLIKNIHA